MKISWLLMVWGLCACPTACSAVELEDIHQKFPAAEVKEIVLETIDSSIEIAALPKDSIEVAVSSSNRQAFHWDMDVKEGALLVKENKSTEPVTGRNEDCRVAVSLSTTAAVRIRSVSGSVKIAGVSQGIFVETASGRIEADLSGGDASIKTTSGKTLLKGLSGVLSHQGISGSLDAQWSKVPETGESLVGTVSGNMYLTFPPKTKLAWDFHGMGGRVRQKDFESDPTAKFFVKAHSLSGNFSLIKAP